MLLTLNNILQTNIKDLTTNDYLLLVAIQIIIAALFVFMVRYFCKLLKKREHDKPIKKTCILISFLSAVAWFIIAQIVWIITAIQISNG